MNFEKYPTIIEKKIIEDESVNISIVYVFRTSDNLLYFDGHFDQAPILPGVVQLDWAMYYGKCDLGVQGAFSGMEAIKFQNVIKAGQQFMLELMYDKSKQKLHFKYFSDIGAHSSGRIVLSSEGNG